MNAKQLLLALLFLFLLQACKKDNPLTGPYNGYPPDIGKIMVDKCATAGCHNHQSTELAGGLTLESWEGLFEGSSGGSAVIPFRHDLSFLTYFINRDSSTGIVLNPAMPYNAPPLDWTEIQMIRDWIDLGARNWQGQLKFPPDPGRAKFYVANQGCDLVAAIDLESKQIMRYLQIGNLPSIVEAPHQIKLSPDNQYFYTVFQAGEYVEKFSTATETLIDKAYIGPQNWNTISITPDGKYGFVTDLSEGFIATINLETMEPFEYLINLGTSLHGGALNPDGTKLYATHQLGDGLSVLDVSDPNSVEPFDDVDLEQSIPRPVPQLFKSHEIAFTPDGQKYLVSCEGTNEVRIFNAATDEILAAISTGIKPQEFTFSEKHHLAFISCMEDSLFVPVPGFRGSVAIIDYKTNSLVKHLYTGHQPHGLAACDEEDIVIVGNRNQEIGGPAPHHPSSCAGNNGYLTLIDLNTLELVPDYKFEVSVDPYSIAVKK